MTIYASIDLGGTNIKALLAQADGQTVCARSIATLSHEGPQRVLARIAALVEEMCRQADARPQALGMTIPGLVDLRRGVTRFLPNLPTNWPDVPVREILTSALGCPVYLLNDVRAATLGELRFGRGRGVGTMAFFALGTGIGGGVVIDGKLRLGPLGAAGELGHHTMIADGPRCGCGNLGCLETLASAPAIVGEGVRLVQTGLAPKLYDLVEGDSGKITPREMMRAAEAGDANVRFALVRAFQYLGIGVANVVVTIHPELVVLGGGMAQIGDLLFDTVRSVVRQRIGMFPTDGVQVEPSALGDSAGALGGIALAVQGGLADQDG